MATDPNVEVPHNVVIYTKILPYTTKLADITWNPEGIVLSGGPSSVYDESSPHVDPAVFELGVPILGICYGCQEIAWQSNSENVARGIAREYGQSDVTIHKVDSHTDRLFAGLGETVHAYMSHFNELVRLPGGFVVVSRHCPPGQAHLRVINSTKLFLNHLKGVTEPQKKRKIIGETLIDLLEKEAIRIETEAENTPNVENVSWFLHGTLYPDVIESLSFRGPSATLKTHHNVVDLPKRMMDDQGLRLLKPLRELFKDEVRNLGRRLKTHEDLVNRFSFPGPGIGVRILGECTHERI
ncbi:uncharacterized protein Triagg1_5118 [Trichoderma aggressivum f. europaeum]|uniref:GMPS ATP-PPase domain-containing protein n=1 Tax=Trichoderma aggressivum f. europaeum TaxID=173218 RepID=A0AAE1M305_9HYPO|nr:hypothetical protein Triagg1_5118 [Trichoderma aggressivum f. europaeum]